MSKITDADIQEMKSIIASGRSLAFNSIGMPFSWLINNQEYNISDKTVPIDSFAHGAEIISLVEEETVTSESLFDMFKNTVDTREQLYLHLGAHRNPPIIK